MNRFTLYIMMGLFVVGFLALAPVAKERPAPNPVLAKIKTIFVKSSDAPGCDKTAPSTEDCYDAAGTSALLDLEKFTCYRHAALEEGADAVLRVRLSPIYLGVISMTLSTPDGHQVWTWAESARGSSIGFYHGVDVAVHSGLRKLQGEVWPESLKSRGRVDLSVCKEIR